MRSAPAVTIRGSSSGCVDSLSMLSVSIADGWLVFVLTTVFFALVLSVPQENVLGETQGMIPDTSSRLAAAVEDLQSLTVRSVLSA